MAVADCEEIIFSEQFLRSHATFLKATQRNKDFGTLKKNKSQLWRFCKKIRLLEENNRKSKSDCDHEVKN